MEFVVEITARAERDLAAIYRAKDVEHSDTARKWYLALKEAILTLEHHPDRCPEIPESRELRHLLYGNKPHIYRIIYRVVEKRHVVEILHIRHGARDRFKAPGTL